MALFKSGEKSNCNNYRPISILPTVRKIIERSVHFQFYDYLQENKLLSIRQFGFRRNRSTSSALLQFTDELLMNMDRGKVSGVIYLDLKKAFDTINHAILLQKLKWIGVDSKSLQWFQSYLSHHTQKTVVNNCYSNQCKVSIGVPQGSVLGPLLFLVYINDLSSCLHHTQASLFADDTAIYCVASTPSELQTKLNEDLIHLKSWLDENRLSLNLLKTLC
jgi:retron-type reverse transcriptase